VSPAVPNLPDAEREPGERAFAPGAFAFYAALEADNSRTWFTEHRDAYEEFVRIPLERFAAGAEERYGPAKVFRPNRDVRFSADKSPYKLNGAMTAGRIGGIYVSVSAEGLQAGGGLYEPTRDQLRRSRETIAADGPPAAELARIVAGLDAAGLELAGPNLTTAPRGVDRDHRRIELLRLTRYAALRRLPPTATVGDIEQVWRDVEALLDWTARYAGPAMG
jgi:uncharacterized protein (TIGR02453 family)